MHCNLIGSVCVYREKQRLNFSVELISQGAFGGMMHDVYLMLRRKSEEMGHLVVTSPIRLVGRKNSLSLVQGCRVFTAL